MEGRGDCVFLPSTSLSSTIPNSECNKTGRKVAFSFQPKVGSAATLVKEESWVLVCTHREEISSWINRMTQPLGAGTRVLRVYNEVYTRNRTTCFPINIAILLHRRASTSQGNFRVVGVSKTRQAEN